MSPAGPAGRAWPRWTALSAGGRRRQPRREARPAARARPLAGVVLAGRGATRPASWPACSASTSGTRSPDRTSWRGPAQLCRRRRPLAGTPTRCPDCPNRASPATRSGAECDAGPRHLTIVVYRPPWRRSAGSGWTRFPITGVRYTRGHQDLAALWAGPSPCASASLTGSGHHQTSAACCARSTATRSRVSGIARPGWGVHTVPVPDCALARPGPAWHPVSPGL